MRAWFIGLVCLQVGWAWGCQLPARNGGGGGGGGGDDDPPYTSARPELACAPEDPEWSRVRTLYDVTEQSVHELITCGGLQVRVANNIVVMLIASNEDLFKDEERAFLEELRLNPFTQVEDGSWTMEIPDSPGSTFTLRFYDPATGEPVTDDVFDLDSYLSGIHIQTEVGFEDMVKNPAAEHAFTFTWEGEGPLAHLLNDGEPLPDGFELQLSLLDFWNASPSAFGPFESVFELEVDSVVNFTDERLVGRSSDAIEVEYDVRTARERLASIASNESLTFVVDRIESRAGELTMAGDTDDLRLPRIGALAGDIDYEVTGRFEGEVHILVQSDFGTGEPYPKTRWSCP